MWDQKVKIFDDSIVQEDGVAKKFRVNDRILFFALLLYNCSELGVVKRIKLSLLLSPSCHFICSLNKTRTHIKTNSFDIVDVVCGGKLVPHIILLNIYLFYYLV